MTTTNDDPHPLLSEAAKLDAEDPRALLEEAAAIAAEVSCDYACDRCGDDDPLVQRQRVGDGWLCSVCGPKIARRPASAYAAMVGRLASALRAALDERDTVQRCNAANILELVRCDDLLGVARRDRDAAQAEVEAMRVVCDAARAAYEAYVHQRPSRSRRWIDLDAALRALDARATTAPRWRPEVAAFADAMERELRENEHKGGWKDCDAEWLMSRLLEEAKELHDVMDLSGGKSARYYPNDPNAPTWQATVLSEAADVANFAMMVADVCGALDARGKEPTR